VNLLTTETTHKHESQSFYKHLLELRQAQMIYSFSSRFLLPSSSPADLRLSWWHGFFSSNTSHRI